MSVVSFRVSADEEKILKSAASAAQMPVSEVARRRVFSTPEIERATESLSQEVEAIAATLTDLVNAIATYSKQIKYAQGLSIAILQIANPDGWKEDMQRMKALAFGDKEEAK